MTDVTYHLFNPASTPLQMIADYILAGDGVYGVLDCFGIRVPVPLLPCEVRGLPPLFPWLSGSVGAGVSTTGLPDEEHEQPAFAPSYHFVYDAAAAPVLDPGRLYQYVVAREGVFLLAGCPGLQVLMPISEPTALPGLASVTPHVALSHPPVGEDIVLQILERALAARDQEGQPIEQLYFLLWEEGGWRLHIPEQDAYQGSVRAKEATPEYLAALIEGHSHHNYRANFSQRDDTAEVRDGGFRVYFVLGNIFKQPELRVRICVHGYEWEVPASSFFTVPQGIVDCVAREWGELSDAANA